MPSPPPAPAAFVISRVMRPGHEEAYGSWVDRVIAAAQVDGGFMSAVRLDQAGSLHHLVLHFDERPSLERWWEGATYIALASEADAFSVGLDQNDSGSVMGFDLPSEVAAKKWKTALVTWLGVVPTLLIVSSVVAWALPDVPRVLQQIVSSVLLTSALTWLILPKVRGWSRFWMMQNEQGDLRKEPG
jgi:antibiotic biosynthesis monooxygenase (ABM) superfamily enzyme